MNDRVNEQVLGIAGSHIERLGRRARTSLQSDGVHSWPLDGLAKWEVERQEEQAEWRAADKVGSMSCGRWRSVDNQGGRRKGPWSNEGDLSTHQSVERERRGGGQAECGCERRAKDKQGSPACRRTRSDRISGGRIRHAKGLQRKHRDQQRNRANAALLTWQFLDY